MFEKIKEVIKSLTPEEKEKAKKEIFEEVKEDGIKDEKNTIEEVNTEEPVNSENIEEEKSESVDSEELTEEEEEKIVENVSPDTNGVRIEDVVLKSELEDRLAALEAKLNSVIKENEDLKDQNSELIGKYEEHDFGKTTKKGILGTAAEVKTEKFEDYAQNFK